MTDGKEVVQIVRPVQSVTSFATLTSSESSLSSNSSATKGVKRKLKSETDLDSAKYHKADTSVESQELVVNQERFLPTSKEVVQQSVKYVLQTWGAVIPVHPDHFLHAMLSSRGYETAKVSSFEMKQVRSPTMKQMMDYDNELVWAIRNSDLQKIKFLWSTGRSMSACNRFCESIVHMACRRAERDVVEFILNHGGAIDLVDDYGRTPLHDACWRIVPRFDVVTLLMDLNIDLIRWSDARGSTPLKYCREEHWLHWCAYLYNQRDKYWAPLPGFEESSKVLESAPAISTKAIENLTAQSVVTTSKGSEVVQDDSNEQKSEVDPKHDRPGTSLVAT